MRRALLLAALLLLPWPAPASAAGLSIAGEPEIGLAADKLDAKGMFPGFAGNVRPYPVPALRKAVGDALAPGGSTPGDFDGELLRWLSWYLAPSSEARAGAGVSAFERGGALPVSDGVPVPDGGSLSASASFRSDPAPWLSVQGSGAAFLADGERGTRLLETSVEAGWPFLSVEAGKISTWYGPGRSGSLVLSNNASPVPGIRLRNALPIALPGPLSFLGTLRYDLFAARLEADRPIPRTWMSGLRLSVRPNRHLEVGVSRVMHFGGEGKPSGLSAWWDAFRGTHENEPGSDGNQIGGFDVSVNLPFRAQPVRIYLEAAGEDEAKILGTPIPGPTKWAYLGGVFLPSLFGSSRADFRAEWAQNHLGGNGEAWYVHAASGEGYAHRYRGQGLGHPMGTDARQLDLAAHWFFLPSTYLELSAGSRKRYLAGAQPERATWAGAGLVAWLTPSLRADGRFDAEKVRNAGFVPGGSETDLSFRATLAYRVAAGER